MGDKYKVKDDGSIVPANLAADPASPESGQFYFNTPSKLLRVYNGTDWQTLDTDSQSLQQVTTQGNQTTDDITLAGAALKFTGTPTDSIALDFSGMAVDAVVKFKDNGAAGIATFKYIDSIQLWRLGVPNGTPDADEGVLAVSPNLGVSTFFTGTFTVSEFGGAQENFRVGDGALQVKDGGTTFFDLTNGLADMSGMAGPTDILMKMYVQDTQPTLSTNGMFALWEDTDDNTLWLIGRNNDTQKKIQFT